MVWTKISDTFPREPRILGLSDAAFRALITALCWANEQLTNGEISIAAAKAMRITPRVRTELIQSGLWDEITDDSGNVVGWWIRDFLKDQPSREDVEEERLKRHEDRVRAGQTRAATARRVGGRFAPADQQDASRFAGDVLESLDTSSTSSDPAPSRPVPYPIP